MSEEEPITSALDRDGEVPLGVQLAWRLRSLISVGALPPGDRLPAARELATAVGVNVNTIRAVYARLEAERLIEIEHGRGTFVARRAKPDRPLSAIAERTARDAAAAGVDIRELAAALYVGVAREQSSTQSATPDETSAADRRAVRREIAHLEEALAQIDLPHLQSLRPDDDPPVRRETARILGIEELEAQRDELVARLALLREAGAEQQRGAETRRQESEGQERTASPAPRDSLSLPHARLTWSFGARTA